MDSYQIAPSGPIIKQHGFCGILKATQQKGGQFQATAAADGLQEADLQADVLPVLAPLSPLAEEAGASNEKNCAT
eukprot:2673651-Amphidinium_carterae.1